MTMAPSDKDTAPKPEILVPEGYVKLTIDGEEVIAPKGELLIRTAERLGTVIPRFCDHPLLDPAAPAGSAWSRSRWAGGRCRNRRPRAR
jgi:NADH-quinone oxidoreductase subunit G